VKQEATVKTESASPAPHMSPALRRASSAGVPIKTDLKIPKKGTWQFFSIHLTSILTLCVFIEFSPEDLLDALSPVLDMLYDQFPDCLPFRQPVDPVLLQIPVSLTNCNGCPCIKYSLVFVYESLKLKPYLVFVVLFLNEIYGTCNDNCYCWGRNKCCFNMSRHLNILRKLFA